VLDLGSAEDPAVAWSGVTLSRGEVRRRCEALASRLGAGPGQRVAIIGPNIPAAVVGLFAAWRTGAVPVPLSGRLRRFELERILADAEPTAIVSIGEHSGFPIAEVVHELAPALPTLARQLVVDPFGEVQSELSFSPRGQSRDVPEEAAVVLYTSGSTGDPKGCILSHEFSLRNSQGFRDLLGDHATSPTAYVVPISNGFGYVTVVASLAAGAPAVLLDTPALDSLADAIERHRVAVLHGSPAMFASLLRLERPVEIQTGFVSGSRCPPEVVSGWESRGAWLLNMWGMSEVGAVTSCRQGDPPEVRYGTVGRALPGMEVRVAPGAQAGEPSEIEIRGRHVWPTLYGQPREARTLAGDGWLRSGDLGLIDSDANVTIVGRVTEVVHVGGFNVIPAEVESFLLTHPQVTSAAVLPIPHPSLGEALVAFVIPSPSNPPTPRELTAFCRRGISGYKVPTSFRLVQSLPLLSSGKVDRQALARELSEQSPR